MSDLFICTQADRCTREDCIHRTPHAQLLSCHIPICFVKAANAECALIHRDRKESGRIAQVRIVMGSYWGSCFVTFRTQYDVDHNLTGRRYRNPSPEGLGRLSRLLYDRAVPAFVDHEQGEIVFGDQTPLPELFG